MVWLDCTDQRSTLAAVSDASSIPHRRLVSAIEGYDEARFEGSGEDPFLLMPREILARFGSSIAETQGSFTGAFYFHGTRSREPNRFLLQGILPLGSALDIIWSSLRDLAALDVSDDDWHTFRRSLGSHSGEDSGDLYRLKTEDRIHWGPHAMLVRDALTRPDEAGIHDYLGCPEIVDDIVQAAEMEFTIPLHARYVATTQPCIVKFRSKSIGTAEVCSAMWYLYSRVRGQPLDNVSKGGFAGQGSAVPAEQVVAVDVIGG